MHLAVAFKDIEADFSIVDGVTKECYGCDPDNPRAVPRKNCQSCGGSGRQPLAAREIAEELSATKTGAASASPSLDDSDDLMLEY
jgi:rRNA maturation endonuclease Nob1